MDPIVGPRMVGDRDHLATDYIKMLQQLKALQASQMESLRDVDVILSPTTRIPALPVATVDESLDVYLDYAAQYMANTNVGNRLGLCGLSVPLRVHVQGTADRLADQRQAVRGRRNPAGPAMPSNRRPIGRTPSRT